LFYVNRVSKVNQAGLLTRAKRVNQVFPASVDLLVITDSMGVLENEVTRVTASLAFQACPA